MQARPGSLFPRTLGPGTEREFTNLCGFLYCTHVAAMFPATQTTEVKKAGV